MVPVHDIQSNHVSTFPAPTGPGDLRSLGDLRALIEQPHTDTGNVIGLNLKPIMSKHKNVFISSSV